MANIISKITVNNTEYELKDAQARADIEAIQTAISGGVTFMGVTTTALTDGATASSIKINNNNVTSVKGYLVVYNSKEFVYDGAKWIELGDLSLIGDLGWKDTATGEYTPVGTVSQPTFTGTSFQSTGSYTPSGSVTISKGTGTANYTPEGNVSQPTFTGSEGNVSVSGTPAGSVTISKGTGTANYTPEGSVSAPAISVKTAGATTKVNSITDVGSLPSFNATVANENLTLSFDAGTLPTKGADQTVKTGDAAYQASAPTFTGTGAELKGSFSGTAMTSTGKFTPAGDVSKPTFTGTGAELKGSFTGTAGTVTVSGTPTGTVSQPTFSGTQGTVTVS